MRFVFCEAVLLTLFAMGLISGGHCARHLLENNCQVHGLDTAVLSLTTASVRSVVSLERSCHAVISHTQSYVRVWPLP